MIIGISIRWLIILFFTSLLTLSGCGGGSSDSDPIGATYQVYGGNTHIGSTQGYNPADYGYTLLGSASSTQTFSGSYDYYDIVTVPINIVYVDTVQGSNGQYYATFTTGNTLDYANVGEASDGSAAAVGGEYQGEHGGYILIDASNDSLSSVTVYIKDTGNTDTNGTVMLSGSDVATVGTQLDTGFVGTSLAAGGQPDYIVIVDNASTVAFTAPNILIPNLADPNNGFVVVVTDDSPGSGTKAISMSIWVSGTKYDYACTTPVSVFIECGINSMSLDIENKTVIFANLTVTNTNTSTVLTMNGTLTW